MILNNSMMFRCLLDCIERMQEESYSNSNSGGSSPSSWSDDGWVRLSFSFETRQGVDGVVQTVLPPSIRTNKRHMDDGWHPHHHILKTSSGQTDFHRYIEVTDSRKFFVCVCMCVCVCVCVCVRIFWVSVTRQYLCLYVNRKEVLMKICLNKIHEVLW